MQLTEQIRTHAARNFSAFTSAAVAGWQPVDVPDVVDWVEDNLRFGRGDRGVQLESRIGPFTYSDSPWWRYIMRCAVDTRVESLAIPAATQTHKTANLVIAVPLFLAEFRPAPAMIVVPDENEAKKIRDRIYAVVEESRKFVDFQKIRIPPRHKWNLQEIDLGSMLLHLAWSGGRQRMRGKACYYVFFTELDVYRGADPKAGDPVEAGKQRTKDVFRYKHIFESSPSEAPSAITDEETLADGRWRWFGECPYCGLRQEPRFFTYRMGERANRGGINFETRTPDGDGSVLMTPKQARTSATYICENGCTIDNDDKARFIEAGEWYPKGWNVARKGEPDRTPARSTGFHLWAIHSANETFGTIAADYLAHVAKGRKVDFWGNRLAIAYEGESRVPNWVNLGRRLAGTHARRTVPDGAWFVTAGIDKQGDANGSRYVIRGWAPGRTSWLIDWGWVARDPADPGPISSDLLDVERRVFVSDFPVVNADNEPSINPLGRRRVRVRLGNIDTNYLPMQIHRWVRQLPEEWIDRQQGKRLLPGRVRNIRGDHSVRPDVRYRRNLVETNARTGEKYEGGLHLWGINVYPYYSQLIDCLSGEPGNVGSWYVTADCLATGKEYLEQVTNFHYSIRVDPRKGKKGVWGPRTGRIPHDFFDCEIYAMVAAEMVVGNLGWDESAWHSFRETADRERAQKKPARRQPRERPDEIGAR